MILYRGTPEPEEEPKPRRYAAVFFSPNLEFSAEYGDFIQKYKIGRQRILEFGSSAARKIVYEFTGHKPARDHNDEVELDLFWHPKKAWVKFVLEAGYTATAMGWNIAIFDLSGLQLLDRWFVEWERGRIVRKTRVP
jgi:hypothetical protein